MSTQDIPQSLNLKILWIYTKYQIISKTLLAVILLPAFALLSSYLIQFTGRTNLSSGDFIQFFITIPGILTILSSLLILVIVIGIDINSFILLSALIIQGKYRFNLIQLLLIGIKSSKALFSPGGLILTLYIALILPLIGMGIKLSPLENFAIPNFIQSVIFANSWYYNIYILSLVTLGIISFIYIFTIHFVLLEQQNLSQALANSRKLITSYWKPILKEYLIYVSKLVLLGGAILLGIFILGIAIIDAWVEDKFWLDFSLIFTILTLDEIIGYILLMVVPINIYLITRLYFKYQGKSLRQPRYTPSYNLLKLVKEDQLKSKSRFMSLAKLVDLLDLKWVVSVLVIFGILSNASLAYLGSKYFKEVFFTNENIEVIAHRGGGNLAAENTLAGISQAIEHKAKWSEIDIQRTADNQYIINHDRNFRRVAGNSATAQSLTLAQIKELRVRDLFNPQRPAQPVATLEEVLNLAKDKIGLFLELKGVSADAQMVDDVVKLVKHQQMETQVVLLSLDYNLIRYIESTYPEMQTGYLYYFATGKLSNLLGDYLIMEEREATFSNIEQIHAAKKKAIVWTVNTPDSMKKFINSSVDGIITDDVQGLNQAIEQAKQRPEYQIILDNLFLNYD